MTKARRFKTKLYLLAIIPLLICYAFYIIIITLYDYTSTKRNCEKEIKSQCEFIAYLVQESIEREEYNRISEIIQAYNKRNSTFIISVVPLRDEIKKNINASILSSIPDGNKTSTEGYFHIDGRIGFINPITVNGVHYGYILLSVPRSYLTHSLILRIIMTSIMAFVFLLFLFLILESTGSFFLIQLEKVQNVLETILKTKNFSYRTKLQPTDELGALGYYIDLLLDEIDKNLMALSSLQKSLENQVIAHKEALQTESTARELAEKKLQTEESKFKDIVDNVNSIILRMKPDGTIIFINKFAEEFFMYEKEELIGKNVIGTIVPPLDSNLNNLKEMILDIGKNPDKYKNNENENIKKNGERVWISWTNKAIYDEDGNIVEILCVGNDLTNHKKMEEEIIEAKKQLEERNQELARLVDEMKNLATKAELANKAKTAFLANMSHEIRTPLNGIIGILHLLSSGLKEAKYKEFLDMAMANAEALLSLLNNLLDLSRVESGEMPIQKSLFSVREIVEEVIQMFWYRAREKNLPILSTVQPSIPEYIIGDASKVRQILINLVGNAIKFTEEGEITISVELKEEIDANVILRFEVTDTGKGLSKEDIGKIFKAFERGNNAEEKKVEGAGLGLAICKQLVELLGGDIGVESNIGEGTKFWFEIRFDKPSEAIIPKLGEKVRISCLVSKNVNLIDRITKILNSLGAQKINTFKTLEEIFNYLDSEDSNKEDFLLIIDAEVLRNTSPEVVSNLQSIRIPTILIYSSNVTMEDIDFFEKLLPYITLVEFPIKTDEFIEAIKQSKSKSRISKIREVSKEGTYRILVAEDNPINQRVIYEFLTRRGYKVDIATDGKEALEKFTANTYHLILMDIELPVLNGYEVTKKIREAEKEKGSRTPIIALTAYSFEKDREKCIEAGMDDFLTKPVSPTKLIETVKKYLERVLKSVPKSSEKSSEEEDNIYDENIALKRLDNNMELLKETLEIFLETSATYISNAEKAINEDDVGSFIVAVHTLKTSSGLIGGMKVSNIARALEEIARKSDTLNGEEIQRLFEKLKDAMSELIPVIKDRLQKN